MDPAYLAVVQRDLEVKSIEDGVARYRYLQEHKDGLLTEDASNKLIAKWVRVVELGIEKEKKKMAKMLEKRPGQGRVAEPWRIIIYAMKSDKLALITLGAMLNACVREDCASTAIQTLCITIAKAVKVQRQFDVLRIQAPDVVAEVAHFVKRWDVRAVKLVRKRAKLVDHRWSKRMETMIGAWLLRLVVECSNLFRVEQVSKNGRKEHYALEMLPEVVEQLEKTRGELELLRPVFVPMVVPPLAHDKNGTGGGYLLLRNEMMKRTGFQFGHSLQPSKEYLDCINRVQSIAWKIDRNVLSAMRSVHESGGNRAGLPRRDLQPTPPPPPGYDPSKVKGARWKNVTKEDQEEWNKAASTVHTDNARSSSQRLALLYKLDIGNRFSKFDRIYFPWQSCWRSRMYPIPSLVHPQADDSGKALLRFERAVPLGQHGLKWLLIHYGNLLGYDKKNNTTCRREALSHLTTEGSAWASDPMVHTGWMNAERYDAPFCLLAAATELHQVFVRLGRYPTMDEIMAGGIGQDFPSSLPVTIDGSCNGLQHLSALGLDPIGAAATNLIPLADPADVYDAVRRVVDSMIERDVAEIMYEDRFPDPNDYPPVAWRGRVTRNTCKRGVMTTPYGVTQQGIFLQLIADGFAKNVPGKATNNARYLKRCIHEAVGTVVVSARAIMDWLQAVSVVLSDDDRAVSWVTPCGVRVTQRYVETRRKTLETVWGSLSLQEPNADWSLSHRDQYRGIAPNVVHSFDAAHLVQTFNLFAQHEPYADVVGTHDAFTTQAGAMETLSRITRESFVSIYSEDWLDKLYQYFQSQTKKEIPKPPARGVLDIRQVLLSEGFFR